MNCYSGHIFASCPLALVYVHGCEGQWVITMPLHQLFNKVLPQCAAANLCWKHAELYKANTDLLCTTWPSICMLVFVATRCVCMCVSAFVWKCVYVCVCVHARGSQTRTWWAVSPVSKQGHRQMERTHKHINAHIHHRSLCCCSRGCHANGNKKSKFLSFFWHTHKHTHSSCSS